jgi:small subunit ribosomal protein S20
MASHKSAVKQQRQSLRARDRNRAHRSRMRSAVRSFDRALKAGDVQAARALLAGTLAIVARTARRGAIHAKTAARTQSRLTRALNRLGA